MAVFNQCLLRGNGLISLANFNDVTVRRDLGGQNSLQPFNVAAMLRKCTNIQNVRCGYVYRSLFPEHQLIKMHLPEKDTLATNFIYRRLLYQVNQ